ncbi:MAG: peptidoglycan-binding protein [Thermodesulfobacteriota bacterium]|nr:peptidoglycan-binding protein [Thermodesulfobacteriota bacterium]
MPDYKVKQGDCLSSIATRHGLFWEKVWNHPKNATLKEKRKDPNVLYPGDVIFIPDKEEKQVSEATEHRHRFRKKGTPAIIRLQLKIADRPRAQEPYILEINGEIFPGTTDTNGRLEHPIPPNAKKGKIIIGKRPDEYHLNLGHLDPIDGITGLQARLNNLGFDCGKIDGVVGPKTEAAIKAFQKQEGLTESGKTDQQTLERLRQVYGC